MKKLLIGILFASLATLAMAKDIDVTESKGKEQSVIISLTPQPANMDVDQDEVITAVFDVELDAKHVHKNNVKLKHITQTKESIISGEVVYDATENAVTFTPNSLLTHGHYEVEFKSLKATKAYKSEQIKEIKYRFYVPEVINGHKLPPEPDETVNNSTLLGIDVNDNGVRDDVERWIYITYRDKHPIYVDIALQAGRAYKQVLETPENAKEIRKIVNAPLLCGWYYQNDAEEFGDPILVNERIDTKVESKYFNTEERRDTYNKYDKLLSGGVYDLPWASERKSFCDFDTSAY